MSVIKAREVKVGDEVFVEGKLEKVCILREASKRECLADRIQVFFASGAWTYWFHDENLVVEPMHDLRDYIWALPA